jgi:hypothetical protein
VRRSLLFFAAAALLSCAHGPSSGQATDRPPTPGPPEPPAPVDPIPSIRAEVEGLLRAQAEAFWTAWTTGAEPDAGRTYQGHERLYALETIATVRAAVDRATGDERRALHYLWSFLAGEYLAHQVTGAADRAASAAVGSRVSWNGRTVPAREVPRLLAAEPEARRREALARAQAQAESQWVSLAQAETAALQKAVRSLGYPDSLALAAELRGAPPATLAAMAEDVLIRTESTYRGLMEDLARRRLDLPLSKVRTRDLPRLFRQSFDPKLFPAARAFATASAPFVDMGLPPDALKSLSIDSAARTGKNVRPLAVAIEVPSNVRLSFVPLDGAAEVRALLHELGVAQFYAHVESPVMELRRLGPASIPAAWALLAEGLGSDPAWLGAVVPLAGKALEEEVRTDAARRLHVLRESAARVLYELEMAKSGGRAATTWSRLFARAYARPVDPTEIERGLADGDPLLHASETLRAGLLAAQARDFLVREAGDVAWWKSAASGTWLRGAWARGTGRTAEELSSDMGYAALDAGALVLSSVARLPTRTLPQQPEPASAATPAPGPSPQVAPPAAPAAATPPAATPTPSVPAAPTAGDGSPPTTP